MKLQNIGKKSIGNEQFVKTKYPVQYAFITTFFKWCKSYKECVYCLNNNIFVQPKCPICGKQVSFCKNNRGYNRACCENCSKELQKRTTIKNNLEKYGVASTNQLQSIKEKQKQTTLLHYGVENPSKSETIKERKKHTTLLHYGVENPGQSDIVKEKIKQAYLDNYGVSHPMNTDYVKNKIKQTKLERYGDALYRNNDKIKQTCLKRYGVENPWQSEEIKNKIKQTKLERYGDVYYCNTNKIYNTKRKNNSFNKSAIEEQFAAWLKDNNINFIRQYKSKQYPFCCDFYFPEKDLYFEINGHCVHNNHPFDANNESDIATLEKWKQKNTQFYKNMIKVWTVTDPLKVKTAKENELNFKVVYSDKIENVKEFYKNIEFDIK